MTAIDTLLREPAIQAIGWALLHFLWQGTLVAVVTALALRALRDCASDVRYVVGAIALSLMVTIPAVTGVQAWQSARLPDADHSIVSAAPAPGAGLPVRSSAATEDVSLLPAGAASSGWIPA